MIKLILAGKLVPSGALTSLISGGALLLASAPAKAVVIYSGTQNVTLLRPAERDSPSNTQSVELIPGHAVEFGWRNIMPFSIPLKLRVGFDAINSSIYIQTDPSSPYAVGSIPDIGSYSNADVVLQQCTYPELTNCSGNWNGGEGFAAFRQDLDNQDFLYGWARIDMPADFSDSNAVARLVDWAYETDVNVPIAMGAGATPDVPGPIPVMGVAAAFAASRRLRRRIRKGQTKPPQP